MTRTLAVLALVLVAAPAAAQDEEAAPPADDADDPGLPEPTPAPAPAPAPTGPRVAIVGATGTSLETTVLVGARGELYQRKDGVWRRKPGGGVAPTLTAASGRPDGTLYAVGAEPPVYRHDGKVWLTEALPVTNGPALLARTATVVLVGRRPVARDGARWKPLRARSGGTCEAFAAGGDDLIAVCGGRLELYDGRGWSNVSTGATTAVALAGGSRPYAALADGSALAFASRRPQKIRAPAAAMRPILAAERSPGKLAVIGREGQTVRLYLEEAGALVPRDALPSITDSDPPALLFTVSDAIIVVTTSGQLFVRVGDGGWTSEPLDPALPAPPAPAPPRNPPARAG